MRTRQPAAALGGGDTGAHRAAPEHRDGLDLTRHPRPVQSGWFQPLTDLTSQNSSIPQVPPSRPLPDWP